MKKIEAENFHSLKKDEIVFVESLGWKDKSFGPLGKVKARLVSIHALTRKVRVNGLETDKDETIPNHIVFVELDREPEYNYTVIMIGMFRVYKED